MVKIYYTEVRPSLNSHQVGTWVGPLPACLVCEKRNHKDGGFWVGYWEGARYVEDRFGQVVCNDHLMEESIFSADREKVKVLSMERHWVRDKKTGAYKEIV